ncbi:Protein OS-9 homolog [Linum perenne]
MKSLWFVIAIYALSSYVLANQILPAQVGGSFSRSSREPKYTIEFHPEDSPFHPDEDQESVVMPDKNGHRYLCYLPKIEKAKSGKPVSQLNMSSMIMETEKRVKLKTPDELLEVLKDRCFIRQEGWWSYEFCYQKKLRQLHVEDDKLQVVQEFVLGVYDDEATGQFNQNLSDISTLKDPRSKDASQRYHAHQYKNGTLCDLTNHPRETEVRFVCSEPRAMVSSITELSTCKLFQEERPVWHTINCNVMRKDYKESKVEKEKSENKQIIMVTEVRNVANAEPDESLNT